MGSSIITVPGLRASRDIRHFFGTRHVPLLSKGPGGWGLQGEGLPERAAVLSVKQVHGTDVLVIDHDQRRAAREADRPAGWDALLTDQADVVVTVRTADCVPILLYDPVKRVVAAVHAGWRGTVAGILPGTLVRMAERFGCSPDTIRVGIGPSIGPCCYEVDAPVLDAVGAAGLDPDRFTTRKPGGKAMLDLGAVVRAQALAAGVPPASIDRVELCTACHPDIFHSYRRDRAVVGAMVSGIVLSHPPSRDETARASRSRERIVS